MQDRTTPPPAHPITLDGEALRASAGGTASFAERHAPALSAGFYRQSPSGLTLSALGVGTYLGDCNDAEDARYAATIAAAVAAGVNVIDTAINYRCQRSERAVGAALEQVLNDGTARRDELVVCSKAGFVPLEDRPPAKRSDYDAHLKRVFFDPGVMRAEDVVTGGHSLAPSFLRYCIERSRMNLGVRTIDVYYVHNPEQQLAEVPWSTLRDRLRAAFETMEEAVAAGAIGAYGCATWTAFRIGRGTKGHMELQQVVELAHDVAGDSHHFRFVQMPLSLAMQEAARTPTQDLNGAGVPALEVAACLGLTVVASASLAQGQLTSGLPDALHDLFPDATTDAQRALAFAASAPGVSTALVGMRRREHLEDNLGAFGS